MTNTNNGTVVASVGSGQTFPVTVNVVASGTGVNNTTTGIDYYFQQTSGPASGLISIFSRDSTGSAYPFLNTPPDDAVAGEVLNPRNAWPDKIAYDKAAEDLRNRFAKNFESFDAPPEVKAAGPKSQR